MQKCDKNCYNECKNYVYQDNSKCVLHCQKNDYLVDKNSGLLVDFYKYLVDYIILNLYGNHQID